MSKYNDNVTFQTNKKDTNSISSLKKLLFLVFAVVILSFVVIMFIISLSNRKVDTRIKNIILDDGIISPDFNEDIYDYQIETELDSLYFTCTTNSKKVKVDGCGRSIKLDEDQNDVIIVSKFKKNQSVYTFHVNKVSKFDISVSGNPKDWTDLDVALKVSANSVEGTSLDNEAYSFDDGETFGSSDTKVFSENEVVYIRVRDVDGNVSFRKKVVIDKIDKNVPTVKVSVKNKKLTAVVTPNKTPSGYKYQWYKNGEKIKGATKINYKAEDDGSYKVVIKNGVGRVCESDEVSISKKTAYAIGFDANGGENAPSDQVKEKDVDLKISSKTPTREGYRFIGWSYTKNGDVDLSSSDIYKENKSCVLYAVWEKEDGSSNTFTINYNGTGGSNTPGIQIKENGKDLKLSSTVPKKTDYVFLGWSSTNGGSVLYKPGDVYKENKSIVLYAVWQKVKTISVSYDGNGAKVIKGKTSAGSNVFTMPNITRSGYTIVGWSTSPTDTTALYKVGDKVTINNSMTLYAITYKQITATFNLNSAYSISDTKQTCNLYNLGSLCSVTMPSIIPKSGKNVVGWSTSISNTNNVFAPNRKVAISQNTTFYAITK